MSYFLILMLFSHQTNDQNLDIRTKKNLDYTTGKKLNHQHQKEGQGKLSLQCFPLLCRGTSNVKGC